MTGRPPKSPLFPYTTLFRSRTIGGAAASARLIGARGFRRASGDVIHDLTARSDRNSTRLNSSHTVISYAVFCLKKKKYYEVAPDAPSFLRSAEHDQDGHLYV